MSISKIDPNLAAIAVKAEDAIYINALDERFSLHGVFFEEDTKFFTRVPTNIAKSISDNLLNLSRRCSGGRLRFVTDSPYVIVKAALPAFKPMPHMSILASHGFSLYADGEFAGRFAPSFDDFECCFGAESYETEIIRFAEQRTIDGGVKERVCELYFPLYGGVRNLFVGIKEGSVLKPAPEYNIKKPFVFYGSSITQGAAVTRPGNDYVSMLARMLSSDYVNLGFSGSGNCEDPIIDYMLSIDATMYAYDYNLYDSRPHRILPDHYELYKKIRNARPDSLILLYDKPYAYRDTTIERRRALIRNTYDRARSEGDDKIFIIDCYDLFGKEDRDSCVVDGDHPSDLGAYRMAQSIYNVIGEAIKRQNS